MFLDIVPTSYPMFTTRGYMRFLFETKLQLYNTYFSKLDMIYHLINKDEKINNFSTRWRNVIELQIAIGFAETLYTLQYYQLDVDKELDTFSIFNQIDINLILVKYRNSWVDIIALFKLYGFDIINKTVDYTKFNQNISN